MQTVTAEEYKELEKDLNLEEVSIRIDRGAEHGPLNLVPGIVPGTWVRHYASKVGPRKIDDTILTMFVLDVARRELTCTEFSVLEEGKFLTEIVLREGDGGLQNLGFLLENLSWYKLEEKTAELDRTRIEMALFKVKEQEIEKALTRIKEVAPRF